MMIIVIRRNIDKVSGYPDIILVDKCRTGLSVSTKKFSPFGPVVGRL